MRWFGYSADLVRLDLRHADFGGNFGHVEGVRRVTGDSAHEARDRAVIAAIGPLLGGVGLEHASARTDVRCVDANVTDGWSVEAWRFLMTERARELARHEPFRAAWRALVVALGEEFIELRGEQVDRFLATSGASLEASVGEAG